MGNRPLTSAIQFDALFAVVKTTPGESYWFGGLNSLRWAEGYKSESPFERDIVSTHFPLKGKVPIRLHGSGSLFYYDRTTFLK